MMSSPAESSGRLLKIADVEAQTSLERSTIYRLIKAGEFPRQVRLSPRRVAWRARDIEVFIRESTPA